MSERRHLHDLPAFGFAFVGLIVGHLLSYLIAIPDPARRAVVLTQSGHAYLHLAGDVAVVLSLAAAVTVGLRAVAGRDATDLPSTANLAWRLGALQAGAFIAMELGERLLSGGGFGELFADHLFGIGIVVQLAIAAVGAVLLRWIGRVAVRIVDALARPPRRRPAGTTLWLRPGSSPRPRPAFAGIFSARAPPLP
jgi:hypothetical protein